MFCLAVRRDTIEAVGPLDENYGVGLFEDDDYNRRVREKGYRIVCAEDSFVHHFGQAAFKELMIAGEYQAIWNANRKYYERKWGPWKAHHYRDESD
jgi:GT2 family glycosyltransferase